MLRFAGERLQALRNQRGITQFQLAKDCDFTPNSVSRWENLANTPLITEVYKIARYFQVPMEYFVMNDKKN